MLPGDGLLSFFLEAVHLQASRFDSGE